MIYNTIYDSLPSPPNSECRGSAAIACSVAVRGQSNAIYDELAFCHHQLVVGQFLLVSHN